MRPTARPLSSQFLRRAAQRAAPRRMAGGPAHEKGSPEFGGFVPPHVATWHKVVGTAFMTTMWLWIFYRAKQDWRHFLVRGARARTQRQTTAPRRGLPLHPRPFAAGPADGRKDVVSGAT